MLRSHTDLYPVSITQYKQHISSHSQNIMYKSMIHFTCSYKQDKNEMKWALCVVLGYSSLNLSIWYYYMYNKFGLMHHSEYFFCNHCILYVNETMCVLMHEIFFVLIFRINNLSDNFYFNRQRIVSTWYICVACSRYSIQDTWIFWYSLTFIYSIGQENITVISAVVPLRFSNFYVCIQNHKL